MRITAEDVARQAGVSRSAVSRTFTDGASVSPQTRARVLVAAAALGYRPNLIARGLTGQGTGLVALVIGAITGPYEAVLLDALSHKLRAGGYWPLLIQNSDSGAAGAGLEEALAYQVDGAIVAAGSVSRALAERCIASQAPLVLIGRILPGVAVDAVCCDNGAGMRQLVECLTERGRRRVAWIGGWSDTFSNVERHGALVAALARHGLKPVAERSGDYTSESGLAQGLTLLTAPEPPDAIVCGNDAMALGVLDAARRLGIDVPGRLSVTGFDDIPAAAWEPYQLTTVRNPVAETVERAFALLERRIGEPGADQITERLAPILARRRSA